MAEWLWLAWGWSARHWWIFALVAELVVILLVARLGFRVGVLVATASRRRITDVAPEAEHPEQVPEVFKPEADRRRQLLRQRYLERAGRLPWNYRRQGMTAEERDALEYELDTGKLDKAIDQIVRDESEKP